MDCPVTDQVWHPYTAWEDYQAGMWTDRITPNQVDQAAHILSEPDVFLPAARAMVGDWPNAAEQNLTDMSQNRRAWVGQATCCHLANVPEAATRRAWWTLTVPERDDANEVADQVVVEWETARAELDRPSLFVMHAQRQPDPSERRTSA